MADKTPQAQGSVTSSPVGQVAKPLKNTMGDLSTVFGIIGLLISFPFSIIALILGILGHNKAKRLGLPTKWSTAGIVLGVIGIAWIALFFLVNPQLIQSILDWFSRLFS